MCHSRDRRGLSETGFVDGHSVKIEYRWAENRYAQLPALAADLVSRKVDAIFTTGGSVPNADYRPRSSPVIVTIPRQGRGEHRPSGQQPRARQQSLSQLK